MTPFDIKRENESITAGTHFWCYGHLGAVPIDDRSMDERYCQGCYEFFCLEAEMLIEKGSNKRPGWWPKGYNPEKPPAVPEKCSDKKRAVAKIVEVELLGTKPPSTEKGLIMQHDKRTRGRPEKAGGVHRSTVWRRERKKEKQGVLL